MSAWSEWWHNNIQTIGITLAFASGGSGFLIWNSSNKMEVRARQAFGIWSAGQLVGCVVAVFVHGYLGISPFVAPLAGLACGIVGIPILRAISRAGDRVEERAGDIADKGIDMIPGPKGDTR